MTEKDVYQQLTEFLFCNDFPIIPEILKLLIDEKEAQILVSAYPPATAGELAELTGIAKDEVETIVDTLFKKGMIFKSRKQDTTRYYRFKNLIQLHDATAVAENPAPGLLGMWKKFMTNDYPRFAEGIQMMVPNPIMRIVPVNVSISASNQILAIDDVAEIVKNARRLAVTKCACRLVKGAPCEKPIEACLQFNRGADYQIERGTGREISREEAMVILKMCEEEGLIHVTNRKETDSKDIKIICNCCQDCCESWPKLDKKRILLNAPSRFLAKVDFDQCAVCETCVDRCFFDAIKMEGEGGKALIVDENCMGCGLCVVTCPNDALTLKGVRSKDFIFQ
ncbi:MAG: hypothetical protein GY864_08260 [Desulfobacterales bacterium]|nr:hypothetical protein [Desulfobacterales bacterium]